MIENQEFDSSILIKKLIENCETVIKGKQNQIKLVVTCLLAKGHVLMEDNPGTGKTVLARTLAGSIISSNNDTTFKRVQFTPDLLPMDLLGSHIFDDEKKEFIFKRGPLFCNVLLADEINRASPKVQSALLEAMAEHQITMGELTYKLSDLFFTIATQNPIETEGTYPLPVAQLDRFFMKIHFGYVDETTEIDIYKDYLNIATNLQDIKQVVSLNDVKKLQAEAEKVYVHEAIIKSVSNLVRATRVQEGIVAGASVRSGITLLKCLRAYALIHGRQYVIEDDLAEIAFAVLDHRLVYKNKEARQVVLKKLIAEEMDKLSKLKLYS